jgi:hypothetical protein
VVLSQEGAGHSLYPVTVGKLGKVEVLVPGSHREQALQIIQDYHAGVFEDTQDSETPADEPPSEA